VSRRELDDWAWQHVEYVDVEWDRALCAGTDPDPWFPDLGVNFKGTIQERICASCPIVDNCLNWAVEHEWSGYWGGTGGKERTRMRKYLGVALVAPEVGVIGHVWVQGKEQEREFKRSTYCATTKGEGSESAA
jgi:WhiB family redox-sensing transcriptional regulator